jgi:hypothetical protein
VLLLYLAFGCVTSIGVTVDPYLKSSLESEQRLRKSYYFLASLEDGVRGCYDGLSSVACSLLVALCGADLC